jgi:hypothetical protein
MLIIEGNELMSRDELGRYFIDTISGTYNVISNAYNGGEQSKTEFYPELFGLYKSFNLHIMRVLPE